MIIIITEIKKKFYDILKNLNYEVADNRESIPDNTPFPHIFVRLKTATRERVKKVVINQIRFTIDIFSEYDGEAEILDIEQKIFEAAPALYETEHVIYIKEEGFRILDDKSTGVEMKHGVLTYLIVVTGVESEEEEAGEEENNG